MTFADLHITTIRENVLLLYSNISNIFILLINKNMYIAMEENLSICLCKYLWRNAYCKWNTYNLYRMAVKLDLYEDRQIGGSIYWQWPNDIGFAFFPDVEIVSSEATQSAKKVVKEIFLFKGEKKLVLSWHRMVGRYRILFKSIATNASKTIDDIGRCFE